MADYTGHEEATAVTDPTADATVIGLLKGLLTRMAAIAGSSPVVTSATGSGAISTTYAPGVAFWLDYVTLKLTGGAPTTNEDFVITWDTATGADYDPILVSEDLSEDGVTSFVYRPDGGPLLCEAGDAISVTWANSNARTFGLRIGTREA